MALIISVDLMVSDEDLIEAPSWDPHGTSLVMIFLNDWNDEMQHSDAILLWYFAICMPCYFFCRACRHLDDDLFKLQVWMVRQPSGSPFFVLVNYLSNKHESFQKIFLPSSTWLSTLLVRSLRLKSNKYKSLERFHQNILEIRLIGRFTMAMTMNEEQMACR